VDFATAAALLRFLEVRETWVRRVFDRSRKESPFMAASDGAGICEYHPLYLAGIEKFNACDYYESHEIWEELWTEYRGDSRRFYQGLIQAAVALYHFGNGNIRGARKLHRSVHDYLDAYAPRHLGLDVPGFLTAFDACLAEVAASTEEFPEIELDPELLPEIHLDPPPA
jgi:predicted metal-dependent hydrolase